jgi:hypothetical protein
MIERAPVLKIRKMRPWVALALAAGCLLGLGACGTSSPSSGSTTTAPSSILPLNSIVSLGAVQPYFPEVTRQESTGPNSTSSGKPKASRQVIYSNSDSSKKVTVSVDQYASDQAASTAFQEAIDKSQKVTGFTALPAPDIGQKASEGIVTQGTESHVGVASLSGRLIIQATIAGYDTGTPNRTKVEAVARDEVAHAKSVLSG